IFSDVLEMVTTMITFNTFFGAAVLLIFFWRRLTARAIMIGLFIWVAWIGLAPWIVPQALWLRRHPSLLLETPARPIQVTAGAGEADVAAGAAQRLGQAIVKPRVVLPAAIFFKQIGRVDPRDANSPLEGIGRFNVETYSLHLIGVPVRQFSPAGLLTARWL